MAKADEKLVELTKKFPEGTGGSWAEVTAALKDLSDRLTASEAEIVVLKEKTKDL